MEDRILVGEGKKQKYGTQICPDPENDELRFCPMDDVEMVKRRRKEVGLPTLETYARRNGFVFQE